MTMTMTDGIKSFMNIMWQLMMKGVYAGMHAVYVITKRSSMWRRALVSSTSTRREEGEERRRRRRKKFDVGVVVRLSRTFTAYDAAGVVLDIRRRVRKTSTLCEVPYVTLYERNGDLKSRENLAMVMERFHAEEDMVLENDRERRRQIYGGYTTPTRGVRLRGPGIEMEVLCARDVQDMKSGIEEITAKRKASSRDNNNDDDDDDDGSDRDANDCRNLRRRKLACSNTIDTNRSYALSPSVERSSSTHPRSVLATCLEPAGVDPIDHDALVLVGTGRRMEGTETRDMSDATPVLMTGNGESSDVRMCVRISHAVAHSSLLCAFL